MPSHRSWQAVLCFLACALGACASDPETDDGGAAAGGPWTLSASLTVLPQEGDTTWLGASAVLPLPGGGFAVGDAYAHRVALFDSAGELSSIHGRPGEGPGEYRMVRYLFPHPRGFLVADILNRRYTVLAEDGEMLGSAMAPTGAVSFLAAPYGIGGAAIASIFPTVKIHWTDPIVPGKTAEWRSFPVTVDHGPVEKQRGRNAPTLSGGPSGLIYMGWNDEEEYRVIAVDTMGHVVREYRRSIARVERPEEELEERVQRMMEVPRPPSAGAWDEGELRRQFRFRPHYSGFHEDPCGRLWVRAARVPPAPSITLFDVFDGDGSFVGEVRVEDGSLASVHVGRSLLAGTLAGPLDARGFAVYPLGEMGCGQSSRNSASANAPMGASGRR